MKPIQLYDATGEEADEEMLLRAGYVPASQLANDAAALQEARNGWRLAVEGKAQAETRLADVTAKLGETERDYGLQREAWSEAETKLSAAEGRVRELRAAYDAHEKYFDLKISVRKFLFGSEAAKPAEPFDGRRYDSSGGYELLASPPSPAQAEPWVPKVGDLVCGSNRKPNGCYDGAGRIVEVFDASATLPIHVEWNNGTRGNYHQRELQPAQAEPQCEVTTVDIGKPTRCILRAGHEGFHDDGCIRFRAPVDPQPPAAPGTPLTVEAMVEALRRWTERPEWAEKEDFAKFLMFELERSQKGGGK